MAALYKLQINALVHLAKLSHPFLLSYEASPFLPRTSYLLLRLVNKEINLFSFLKSSLAFFFNLV